MPSLNLRKPLYDALIRNDEDPTEVVNASVAEYLRDEHNEEIRA